MCCSISKVQEEKLLVQDEKLLVELKKIEEKRTVVPKKKKRLVTAGINIGRAKRSIEISRDIYITLYVGLSGIVQN